jgi:hypothetical protein
MSDRFRRGIVLSIVAVIGLGLLLVGVTEAARTRGALVDPQGGSHCRDLIGDRPPAEGRKANAYTLAPRTPDQTHQLAFGTSRQAEYVTVEFDETGPPGSSEQVNTVLHTKIAEFQRTDGRKFHNPKDQIWTQAIIGNRHTVDLRVCFDPGTGRRVIPGTYAGTVAIDDDSLSEPAVASVQVTLKYPDLWGPLLLVLAGALAAIGLKAAADETTKGPSTWLGKPKNRAALIFGFAAAVAVFGTYLRSEEWGANGLLDVGALFAASFAGFLAGLTAHQAGENAGKGS